MNNRALLPTHLSSAVPAIGARAAVLFFAVPVEPVSSQSFAPGTRLHLFAADHAGIRLDVPPRHARGGHQCTLAFDRRRAGFGDGGRGLQTPPLEFLTSAPCYTALIRSD